VKRRDFLQTAGLAATTAIPALSSAAPAVGGKQIEWKMVTAWPKNFPGSGAERLARRIGEMSDGRLTVKVCVCSPRCHRYCAVLCWSR
jgi:TRAP-type mannitol/chloroaromatic compound transport system substrate-binding protein